MNVPEAASPLPENIDPAPLPIPRTLWLLLVAILLVIATVVAFGVMAFTGEYPGPLRGMLDSRSTAAQSDDGVSMPAPPPPEVGPVEFLEVEPTTAKEINDAVPFTTDPVPAASPYSPDLAIEDRERAIDCLAAAAWYEAGNDLVGQQAVVQVVLNRQRHAAFPNTVCGVVFQGSQRKTGCQFSFTCDGSMIRRKPSASAWSLARGSAISALRGVVFGKVGWATHYHTDWVVPKWSSSVDKVAAVDTHLFFRWRGANGQARAFQQRHQGKEPTVAALRTLSAAHRDALPEATADGTIDDVASAQPDAAVRPKLPEFAPGKLRGNDLYAADTKDNVFVLSIKPDEYSGTLALVGLEMCRNVKSSCTVAGFLGSPGRAISRGLGRVSFPDRNPDFYYFVDRSRGREIIYWNCDLLQRPQESQCMPGNFRAEG